MKNIEIQGYKNIVPNRVFSKENSSMIQVPIIGNVEASELMKISSFYVPSIEETINFIRKNAESLYGSSFIRSEPSEDDSTMGYALKGILASGDEKLVSEIERIAKGDKSSIDHLKSHYPGGGFKENETYLETFNGSVPNILLGVDPDLDVEQRVRGYGNLITIMGNEKWGLRIKLENGELPDKGKLEVLLDNEVRDSGVFSVGGSPEDYNNVISQIRGLYDNLDSPEAMSKVGDSSYEFLERQAISTLSSATKCILEGNPSEDISYLKDAINDIMGNQGEEEQRPPEDLFGPFGTSFN